MRYTPHTPRLPRNLPRILGRLSRLAIGFYLSSLFLHMAPQVAFAQSQVEIESEINMGESDAAMADEEQTHVRMQAEKARELEARKDAKIESEMNRKKTADTRARIEKMKAEI